MVAVKQASDSILEGTAGAAAIVECVQSKFSSGASGTQLANPVENKGLEPTGLDSSVSMAGTLLVEQDAMGALQQGLCGTSVPQGRLSLPCHMRLRSPSAGTLRTIASV